jgi:hypothetical protein
VEESEGTAQACDSGLRGGERDDRIRGEGCGA